MQLRSYQFSNTESIYKAWQTHKYLAYVLPTGGGKTVVMSYILQHNNGFSCVIAHRQEIVSQISLALARCGVYHRIAAPKNVIKLCVKLHLQELGKSFYNVNGRVAVAGVRTINSNKSARSKSYWIHDFITKCNLWMIDECHHVLKTNEWGLAIQKFPSSARGLGVTATLCRTDGKGLGYKYDGYFQDIIEGPDMTWLINNGFLSDYKIICPHTYIDLSKVDIGSTGDYVNPQLVKAIRESKIIGDVISSYFKFIPGKKFIVFTTDIQTSNELADQFKIKGVKVESISSKTPDTQRVEMLSKFAHDEIQGLVNVDLFGEGFDLPTLDAVILARPTQSLGLFRQQVGRALRYVFGKIAYIIDHVGNTVVRHGLPDRPHFWSLEPREKRSSSNSDTGLKVCRNCLMPYDKFLKVCPYCQFVHTVESNDPIAQVEGDLILVDKDTIRRIHESIHKIDRPTNEYKEELLKKGLPYRFVISNLKSHEKNQIAQSVLRSAIDVWAGFYRHQGLDDSEIYRRFYHTFNVFFLSACALKKNDAIALYKKIMKEVQNAGTMV